MGNIHSTGSGPLKAKYPSTAPLPAPPSPFLSTTTTGSQSTATPDDNDLLQSVMRRLISAMSTTTLSTARLPPNLLLLIALFGTADGLDSDKMDVRVIFSDPHFGKAFAVFEGVRVREDLVAVADIVAVAKRWREDVDGEYYVLARMSALKDPNALFAILLSVILEGFGLEATKEEIKVRLSLLDAILCVLQTTLSAVQSESCEFMPSFPALTGLCRKYEFVNGVLTLILQFHDHIKAAKNVTLSIDDFEVSSFNVFSSVAKNLYINKRYSDCLGMSTFIYDFYDSHALALLPLCHLTILQCLCGVHLGDNQTVLSICNTLEKDIEQVVQLMNELVPSGSVIQEYQPTIEHFYYFLMCTAVNANNVNLIVHFARCAQTTPATTLTTVVTTMSFVTLLDDRRWLEAYSSISRVPNSDTRRDCVKRFLSVLLEQDEREAGEVLCSLPLCEHYSLIEETLLLKAKMSILRSDFLHKLLFTFYMHHGDYRGAAGAMYRLASRTTETHLKRRYLLLTVTCLELISADFQWIAMTNEDDDTRRQLFMFSIDDIRGMMRECRSGESVGDCEHLFAGICDADSAIRFAQPFINSDDRILIEYVVRLPTELQLPVYKAFPECQWLMDDWRRRSVNEYLQYTPSEAESVLDEHVMMWKKHGQSAKLGITNSRPRDLLSATVFTTGNGLERRYYEEYLPLTLLN